MVSLRGVAGAQKGTHSPPNNVEKSEEDLYRRGRGWRCTSQSLMENCAPQPQENLKTEKGVGAPPRMTKTNTSSWQATQSMTKLVIFLTVKKLHRTYDASTNRLKEMVFTNQQVLTCLISSLPFSV